MCSDSLENARFYGRFFMPLRITTNYALQILCGSPHNVGNEEAKLIGMEGNRHIGDAVYAGPLYLVADQNGDLRSLTDEQILTYGKMFEEPEDISPEEVEADTGFYIY